MTIERTMGAALRLSTSVEAFAALGAELRLRQAGLEGDLSTRELLRDVVRAIDPQLLNDSGQPDVFTIAFIQTTLRQALDLLERPDRSPGWDYRDPDLLQAQGQLSGVVVRGIGASLTRLPELRNTLQRPGTFLDIGTGVGWLAIEVARAWPAMRVVGIDPWEPALVLARENLAQSDVADRVELRMQSVEQLDEVPTFAVVWLPGPFIAPEIADRALARIRRALAPGGWLIFGLNAVPQAPLERALASLRTARSGGHLWDATAVEERLRVLDFSDIETFPTALPIQLVIGRRSCE
jgi:SAM-dependent methyltransferase